MKAIQTGIKALEQIWRRDMAASEHQRFFIGVMAFFGFPLGYYWLWSVWSVQPPIWYLSGALLGLGLLLSSYWPESLKRYFHGFWFLSLLFLFPFFFGYLFLVSKADDVASMALLSAVFLLVLLVDLFSLCLLLLSGFILAWAAYYYTVPDIYFSQEHIEVLLLAIFFIVAGSTVHYKTALLQRQRMVGIAAAAGMIAHELRTPLSGINSAASALKTMMPKLLEGYRLAGEHALLEKPIRTKRIAQLQPVPERIIREMDYANSIIEILLMKAGGEQHLQNYPMETCSMAVCIREALERYPFPSEQIRALVHWQGDFKFMGSIILMEHVIFNLLKNALHAIAEAGEGEITVWTESREHYHYLYFKDTAKGMSPEALSHLFDHFYTTTFMGTGIGLSFCKMVMRRFGGDITCESEGGLYTTFTLIFPVITPDRPG